LALRGKRKEVDERRVANRFSREENVPDDERDLDIRNPSTKQTSVEGMKRREGKGKR